PHLGVAVDLGCERTGRTKATKNRRLLAFPNLVPQLASQSPLHEEGKSTFHRCIGTRFHHLLPAPHRLRLAPVLSTAEALVRIVEVVIPHRQRPFTQSTRFRVLFSRATNSRSASLTLARKGAVLPALTICSASSTRKRRNSMPSS